MQYLLEQFGVWAAWGGTSLFLILRYLIFTGGAYYLFYILGIKGIRKIQTKQPGRHQLWSEIGSSIQTFLLISTVAFLLLSMSERGWMQIYWDIYDYPLWWIPVSLILLVLIHDSYFYWMHWALHHFRLLRPWHVHHHLSHNPTPFTSFSFHPGEAFLEVAIVPILLLFMPCHRLVLLLFTTFLLFINIVGHLGYEPYPAWFARHPLLRWLNSSTHHNMHHKQGRHNFGLYFNFWDTWMGTNAPDYEERFLENAKRVAETT